MKRYATILLALSLGFAACAHDHALERHEVAAQTLGYEPQVQALLL